MSKLFFYIEKITGNKPVSKNKIKFKLIRSKTSYWENLHSSFILNSGSSNILSLNNNINKYCYSTTPRKNDCKHNENILSPWFFTGFTDAEGYFSVFIKKNPRFKTGYQVETRFGIHLHNKDIELLKLIQAYLGGIGKISISGKYNSCEFIVSPLRQNFEHIISHFDNYPLITQKQADYLIWREVIHKMQQGEHLTTDGLQSIVNLKASLNLGLSESLKAAFPQTLQMERKFVVEQNIPHPQWLAGFTSGDGSFMVRIFESKTIKIGFQVLLMFEIAQNFRDYKLIKSLITYFGCGGLSENIKGSCAHFIVTKFAWENYEKIIPFFSEYKIIGEKSKDFKDWCAIAQIIKTGGHLTPKGLDQIRIIKAGMNQRRSTD